MQFSKLLFKYILKGILYAFAFAVIGLMYSIFKGWPYLKGAYIFVLGGGILTMVVAVILLIGTPQMRKSIHFDRETAKNQQRGAEGIGPALMGLVMMIIGFWLEAIMH